MTGTMTTLQRSNAVSPALENMQRIPRTVRCRNCGSLSREEAREQKTGEVTVRYECGYCSQTLTRHYFDETSTSH